MYETFNQREIFTSPAHPFGKTILCHLQIFEGEEVKPVVVLTEIEGNPGASVTNSFEYLAEQVRARFLGGREAIYVEHYPVRKGIAESFDLVEFDSDGRGRYCRPHWRSLGEAGFDRLVNTGQLGVEF